LSEDTLVIADEKSAIAIAGVIGGMGSSTLESSTEILLEAAFFEPVAISGVARSYGLHTEASLRFERGVDFNMAGYAMERATELVLEICGGTASEINETVDSKSLPELEPINISIEKISKVLGFDLDPSWVESKFKFLDFDFKKNKDMTLGPLFRQAFVLIFAFQQTSLRSWLGFMVMTRSQSKDSLSMPIYRMQLRLRLALMSSLMLSSIEAIKRSSLIALFQMRCMI
jgi:phenylalanyl-tRNA synthetase beta subunit